MLSTLLIFILINTKLATLADELWEQDLSQDMQIGVAESGYESVQLRCGANSMQIDITLSEDENQGPDGFQGVIYTRGSFHRKQKPCFVDSDDATSRSNNGRSYTLKFPLNKCQTLQEGDIYSNVVVVQYDKDLIMPGDAAFNVECDFSKPRDVTVSANLNDKRKVTASRISLTDADPGSTDRSKFARAMAESQSERVIFTPSHIGSKLSDEL